MSKAAALREEFDIAIQVAELEDELVELKAGRPRALRKAAKADIRSALADGDGDALVSAATALLDADEPQPDEEIARVKAALREWRCVLRLGRPEFTAKLDDNGDPVLDKNGNAVKVKVNNGFKIVDGVLVEKEA